MCFDNLIKIYASYHYYNTSHMIINHLQLYKHVLSDIGNYFSKNKINSPKHLKTYIFVKLFEQDKTNDKIT
jgi:hypothetical protein